MESVIEGLKIQVLVDNTSTDKNLLAEAGFAAIIDVIYDDSTRRKVLLDSGSLGLVIKHNSRIMNRNFQSLDAIVLSHGHWDHVGGLMGVLTEVNDDMPVICHPMALVPKVRYTKTKRQNIGFQDYFSIDDIEREASVIRSTEPYRLFNGVMTTGEVPRKNDYEKLTGRLKDVVTLSDDGQEVPDELPDDLSLIFEVGESSIVILTGCCHSGIVNTMEHALDITGADRIVGVVGGLHLHDADSERLDYTVEKLKEFDVESIAPCHCTGIRGRATIMQHLGRAFKDVSVGYAQNFAR